MKLIIAGSRRLRTDKELVWLVADGIMTHGLRDKVSEVVSGGARGIDLAGEAWAELRGIPIKRFPADWDRYGKAAGPIRNQAMAEYGDALLAIWDNQSLGTKHMISSMRLHAKPCYVYVVE